MGPFLDLILLPSCPLAFAHKIVIIVSIPMLQQASQVTEAVEFKQTETYRSTLLQFIHTRCGVG